MRYPVSRNKSSAERLIYEIRMDIDWSPPPPPPSTPPQKLPANSCPERSLVVAAIIQTRPVASVFINFPLNSKNTKTSLTKGRADVAALTTRVARGCTFLAPHDMVSCTWAAPLRSRPIDTLLAY